MSQPATPIRPLSNTGWPAPAPEAARPEIVPRRELGIRTDRARQVGAAIGKAVGVMATLPQRVSRVSSRTRAKVVPIANTAGRHARVRVLDTRDRARYYIHEQPLKVLGGILVGAMVIGAVVRIWRTRD